MAQKYRNKKSDEIVEAMRLDGSSFTFESAEKWVNQNGGEASIRFDGYDFSEMYLVIFTLEGKMAARAEDYLIKGVQGEFYPCKPDIFAETYDKI